MQDVLVFLSSDASPSMAPWGGVDKLAGNNPWPLSASAGNFPYFMLDISNLAVARGKLHHAKTTNKLIQQMELLATYCLWQVTRDMQFQWQWMYYRVFCPLVSLEAL